MMTILRMSDRRMGRVRSAEFGVRKGPPRKNGAVQQKTYLDVRHDAQNGLGELTARFRRSLPIRPMSLRRLGTQMVGKRVEFQRIEQLAEAGHEIGGFGRGVALVEPLGELVEQSAAVRPADAHNLVALFEHLIDAGAGHAERLALAADRFGAAADAQSAAGQLGDRVAGVDSKLLDKRL